MTFPFTPAKQPTLPIYGSSELRFPVNNIYCVARNYADHALEMGHDPTRELPFFFMKPSNALVSDNEAFRIPSSSQDVHHEVEMVIALKQGGRDILPDNALSHIYGYAVGIDMTCRDIQSVAKKAGRPWEAAKGFPGSAPCSGIIPGEICHHPQECGISLTVNGNLRQSGDIRQMIWKSSELISILSSLFTLEAGDLIFTGTPAGVGAVKSGDLLEAQLDDIATLKLHVI